MFVRIWFYDAVAATVEEFERVYAGDGDWAELFRRSPGFRETELFRSQGGELRYLTVDRFDDEMAWLRFLGEHRQAYDALDARCAGLCTAEQEIWSGATDG
jgi:heme-degrading monooxygenase HmoA